MGASARVMVGATLLCVLALAVPGVVGRKSLITGKSFSDRLFGYDGEKKEFQAEDYVFYVAERALFFILFGLLHFLAIFAVVLYKVCFRFICKICTKLLPCGCGCCKTRRGVRVLKFLLLAAVVVSGLLAVGGVVFNTTLQIGLRDTTDHLLGHGRDVVRQAQETADRITSVPRTADVSDQIQPSLDKANDILDRAQKIDDTWDEVRPMYEISVYCFFLVPLAFLSLAFLCGMFNITMCWALMFAAFTLLFFTFVIYQLAALHTILWFVTSDGCKEVDNFQAGGNARQLFDDALKCANGTQTTDGGGFDSFLTTVNDAINEARTAACVAANALCALPPPNSCTRTCIASNYDTFSNETLEAPLVGGSTNNVTYGACASQCTDNPESDLAVAYHNALIEIRNFTDIKNENIQPLLECRFVDAVVDDIDEDVCNKTTPSLYTVTLLLCISGLVLDVAVISLILGQTRFGKVDDANAEADKDASFYYSDEAYEGEPTYQYEYEYDDDDTYGSSDF